MLHMHEYLYVFSPALIYRRLNKMGGSLQKILYNQMFKISLTGASLVAQWLRVCLPMQGTRVRALIWEDPACRGAAGPVSRNC